MDGANASRLSNTERVAIASGGPVSKERSARESDNVPPLLAICQGLTAGQYASVSVLYRVW